MKISKQHSFFSTLPDMSIWKPYLNLNSDSVSEVNYVFFYCNLIDVKIAIFSVHKLSAAISVEQLLILMSRLQ